MLFSDVNFKPDEQPLKFENGDWVACPKCDQPVVRHLFWNQNQERLFTYHCAEHGDVIPTVKTA
jgi:hypothetical protein